MRSACNSSFIILAGGDATAETRGGSTIKLHTLMATSGRQSVLIAKADGLEAALLQGEMISVEREPARSVILRKNIYTRTNFYIQQSRPYFRATLNTYVNLLWHQWFFIAVFCVGLFTLLDPVFAIIWFCLGIFFFFLYLQHMYVNITTMPYVLSQPSLPDNKLNHSNGFFVISYASYTAMFGETDEASIRGLEVEGGKIKVQAFQKSAMRRMKICVAMSTFGFFGSIWMMDYCLAWFIVFIGTYYYSDEWTQPQNLASYSYNTSGMFGFWYCQFWNLLSCVVCCCFYYLFCFVCFVSFPVFLLLLYWGFLLLLCLFHNY